MTTQLVPTVDAFENSRNHADSPVSGTITTQSNEDSCNDSGDQNASMMTTLCKCGCGAVRRDNSIYFSAACRKRVYERGERAQARRTKYWNTEKGHAVRKRYQDTGATAAASRRYRERAAYWGLHLKSAIREHGIDHVRPEHVWTDEEIRELNIRSLWDWLGSSSLRIPLAKKRLDIFFQQLVNRQKQLLDSQGKVKQKRIYAHKMASIFTVCKLLIIKGIFEKVQSYPKYPQKGSVMNRG